jgi:hypothetical protein
MKQSKMIAPGAILSLLFVNLVASYTTEKTGFTAKCRDDLIRYKIFAVYVLPGEEIDIEISDPQDKGNYALRTNAGTVITGKNNRWRWQAPQQAGHYTITIIPAAANDTMNLSVFVMVPIQNMKGEYLNGYRIGNYPEKPLRGLKAYEKPKGFIEVTAQNQDLYISPHFQLKQFLCKQNGGFPKYVVLREKLLSKLEVVLEKINEAGYKCETFHVMSGYRTPYYNEAIRDVRYSRHIYGDAADIFIDVDPEDERMDDLNKDGKINFSDADVMYDIIDELYGKSWYEVYIGGLGKYGCTDCHGPFVHIDVRGHRARW